MQFGVRQLRVEEALAVAEFLAERTAETISGYFIPLTYGSRPAFTG
jgi:hypothetical protein